MAEPTSRQSWEDVLDTPPLAPLTSFIGREAEVGAVARLFTEQGARLVTITGPGGVGKTRLALAVAEAVRSAFPAGVLTVGLAPVIEPALVPVTIARSLGVSEASDRTLATQVAAAVRDSQLLLMLDNFEHVLPAAPFVTDLLRACPNVAILTTSRERLRLGGEREFALAPLALPSEARSAGTEELAHNIAVRLFAERAREVDPAFAVTDENVLAIAEICRRVDGLPLAIELAAAWAKVLPPATLVCRLEHRLPFLVGGARDAPSRQRTLRDTIAWSYDLLDADEQAVFRRLSVFVGGWTVEAAEAVVGDGIDTLVALASLVDKSLIRRDAHSAEGRFYLLETIREFASERLQAHDETHQTRRRHAMWFSDLADRADLNLLMPNQERWLEALERDHANLRAAFDWLAANNEAEPAVRLSGALRWFCLIRGYVREGRERMQASLDLQDDTAVSPRIRARALTGIGFLSAIGGDLDASDRVLARALDEAHAANDAWEIG